MLKYIHGQFSSDKTWPLDLELTVLGNQAKNNQIDDHINHFHCRHKASKNQVMKSNFTFMMYISCTNSVPSASLSKSKTVLDYSSLGVLWLSRYATIWGQVNYRPEAALNALLNGAKWFFPKCPKFGSVQKSSLWLIVHSTRGPIAVSGWLVRGQLRALTHKLFSNGIRLVLGGNCYWLCGHSDPKLGQNEIICKLPYRMTT